MQAAAVRCNAWFGATRVSRPHHESPRRTGEWPLGPHVVCTL